MPVRSQTPFGRDASAAQEVIKVRFCELVNNPKFYFEKTVRVTATFKQATEGANLEDEQCDKKERLGVGSTCVRTFRSTLSSRNKDFELRFDRQNMRVMPSLRLWALRDIARHQFVGLTISLDIIRFERVAAVIVIMGSLGTVFITERA